MSNEITLIRLTSGEELLAEMTDPQFNIMAGNDTLIDIAIIIPTEAGIALTRFMPYADTSNGLDIPFSSILFTTSPTAELLEKYRTIFPSNQGIIQPESKIIY